VRLSITYLLMIWLTFFAACGFRTPPVPSGRFDRYGLPGEGFQIVSQAKLSARGDTWVFRWKTPEGLLLSLPTGIANPPLADASSDISLTDASSDTPPVVKPVISIFRINIFKSTDECSLCEPETVGHFLIDLNSGEIEPVFPQGITLPLKQRFFIAGNNDFRFDLPIIFFKDNGLIERCFYTIDYFLASGLLSVPSQRLYPLDLKTVPQPKVRVRQWFSSSQTQPPVRIDAYVIKTLNRFLAGTQVNEIDGPTGGSSAVTGPQDTLPSAANPPLLLMLGPENRKSVMIETLLEMDPYSEICQKPRLEFFLLLQWVLQQETLRHILQKDGKLNEQVVHYGINFYKSNQIKHDLFQISEQLINPEPLLYGSFSLLNFQGQLLARQVDRFGNESESIPVFSGRY
jgi:hypothetical protein